MSGAALWIYLPFLCGLMLLFFSEKRGFSMLFGIALCGFLILTALRVPVNSMIVVGRTSIIFTADTTLLGRTMSLSRSEQTIIAFFYFLVLLWSLGSYFIPVPSAFVPVALMETALMIGVMAVQPFVYGTFFVFIAVMLSLPLLWMQHTGDSQPIFRFLLCQLLGMICFALGGWLATSMDMNSQDAYLLKRTIVMIFMGMVFWLAVFPFFTWIAALMEKNCPFISGFIVCLLQFSAQFILLNFLNDHLWLRTYKPLFAGLRFIGALMLLIGASFALSSKNLQRLIAFMAVAENGCALLLLGARSKDGIEAFLSYLFIHLMVMLIWSMAAKYLSEDSALDYDSLRGLYHRRPVLCTAVLMAHFTVSGLPLMAGFPLRMTLLNVSFSESSELGWVVALGCTLLLFSGLRLMVLFLTPGERNRVETFSQRAVLIVGMILLTSVEVFPGIFEVFITGIRSQYALIFGG